MSISLTDRTLRAWLEHDSKSYANCNMSTSRGWIYSYRMPIAYYNAVDDFAIIDGTPASITTQRHQRHVRSSVIDYVETNDAPGGLGARLLREDLRVVPSDKNRKCLCYFKRPCGGHILAANAAVFPLFEMKAPHPTPDVFFFLPAEAWSPEDLYGKIAFYRYVYPDGLGLAAAENRISFYGDYVIEALPGQRFTRGDKHVYIDTTTTGIEIYGAWQSKQDPFVFRGRLKTEGWYDSQRARKTGTAAPGTSDNKTWWRIHRLKYLAPDAELREAGWRIPLKNRESLFGPRR